MQAPRTFRQWSQSRPLRTSLARAEASVRAQPRNTRARRLLFDLLCILGQWERAEIQLRILADADRALEQNTGLLAGLVRAERQRVKVLSGLAAPSVLGARDGITAPWILQLSQALRRVAQLSSLPGSAASALAASDELRAAALAGAPETPGRCDVLPGAFSWICDTDTRLGQVCEVILPQGYHWIALDDLRSLHMEAPTQLLDLVWGHAVIEPRHGGGAIEGFLPMRYPVREGDRDGLLLGRETVWSRLGKTGVLGHGQKVWSTDRGDIPLLDLRWCGFHGAA